MPAKHDSPDQIENGLIVVDLPWHHEDRQDNPIFSSIDDVMGVVAQMSSTAFQTHRGGIRIGGAYAQICCSLVSALDFSLRPTFFSDPIVASCVVSSKLVALRLGNGGGERKRI